MPGGDREAAVGQPAADGAGAGTMDEGGLAEGLEGAAAGRQEQAVQQDWEHEAGPDAEALGTGEAEAAEALDGRGPGTKNQDRGTRWVRTKRFGNFFFLPPGALSLYPATKRAMVLNAIMKRPRHPLSRNAGLATSLNRNRLLRSKAAKAREFD